MATISFLPIGPSADFDQDLGSVLAQMMWWGMVGDFD